MVKAVKAAKLADQIRDYLALWATRQLPGYFFSVTQVTITPDMQQATVWVACLLPDQETIIIKKLNKEKGSLKKRLEGTLSRRLIPNLHFASDTRAEFEHNFDKLLNG